MKYLLYTVVLFLSTCSPVYAQEYPHAERTPDSTESLRVYPGFYGGEYSTIELHDPTVEDAVATVTFRNEAVHGPDDNEVFNLEYNGILVTIHFKWTEGHDLVEVIADQGYFVSPQSVYVAEGGEQEYHLYEYLGS